MRNKVIFVSGLLISIISCLIIAFYYQHEVKFELECAIPVKSEFYPDAYEFFHDEKSMNEFFERTEKTREYKKYLCKGTVFDFSRYSYCIFDGRRVKSIHYSYKSTFFEDPSPSYARPWGLIPVFVDYYDEECKERGEIYLYRIERDSRLRGFYGI